VPLLLLLLAHVLCSYIINASWSLLQAFLTKLQSTCASRPPGMLLGLHLHPGNASQQQQQQ
jgi:hypothetical protein